MALVDLVQGVLHNAEHFPQEIHEEVSQGLLAAKLLFCSQRLQLAIKLQQFLPSLSQTLGEPGEKLLNLEP